MSSSSQHQYWALLIGVNFHTEAQYRIRGAVADVEAVAAFLGELRQDGGAKVNVTSLTANNPIDFDVNVPPESASSLPTEANVREALGRLSNQCSAGDSLYIHFSGHGSQCDLELGLVLYSPSKTGHTVLPGRNLAESISSMVNKGVKVTLVLDCCFSGGVSRDSEHHGSIVRAMPTKASSWRWHSPTDTSSSDSKRLEPRTQQATQVRSSVLQKDWIINPQGYTILAACAPHEVSRELEFVEEGTEKGTGERRGALSFFLLEALGNLHKKGLTVTHQTLYQHISVLFHVCRPSQTPMRYGNENLSFFGELCIPDAELSHLVFVKNKTLFLRGGIAHGVHKGDKYVLRPSSLGPPTTSTSVTEYHATVTKVSTLTSELEEDTGEALDFIETGWKAKPISSLSPWQLPVHVSAPRPKGKEVPSHGRYLRLHYSDDDGRDKSGLTVIINEQHEYEVLDETLSAVANIPKVAKRLPDADDRLIHILEHVSTFKYLQSIDNPTPNPQFERSFSVTTRINDEEIISPLRLTCGSVWTLCLENRSKVARFFTIFQFASSWDVSNLLTRHGGIRVLAPYSKFSTRLEANITDGAPITDGKPCIDVLKIFITGSYSHFPNLILPKLSAETSPSVVRDGDEPRKNRSLQQFFAALCGSRDATDEDEKSRDGWATRSIIVETSPE